MIYAMDVSRENHNLPSVSITIFNNSQSPGELLSLFSIRVQVIINYTGEL